MARRLRSGFLVLGCGNDRSQLLPIHGVAAPVPASLPNFQICSFFPFRLARATVVGSVAVSDGPPSTRGYSGLPRSFFWPCALFGVNTL
jgi:hypothetical protein